ncbi:MAG: ComEA family DNA-binding protein [Lachnospiraceae bacterium]|nr:ComEA family DNA-binding protein [Lachnospiraceae bacterium]
MKRFSGWGRTCLLFWLCGCFCLLLLCGCSAGGEGFSLRAQTESGSDASAAEVPVSEGAAGTDSAVEGPETEPVLVVYLSGAVARPGLYEASPRERLGEMLERAGGALPDADLSRINLARRLSDEEHIHIPRAGESLPETEGAAALPGGKLDLNAATLEDLMRLPGIGEKKARAILDYRARHGPFASPEEVMRVPGIKEGVYAPIAELVTVR